MKWLLILIFTITLFAVQAQDKNRTQKILIGFNLSPDYSFRTLKNNDGGSSGGIIIKSRNDIEIAKLGYTTGINAIFNFSKQIALETGIQYSNKGYKTKNQDLVYFPPNPNLPSKAEMNYSYNYIGIPIKAKFTFANSDLHFITSVGFMTNFLLNVKQTSTYQYSDGKTEKKTQSVSGFNKVDISPMISVGIDYKVNGKIHLIVEPTFRYGILKTRDAPIAEKLWNGGVNLGFYYALK
jgi:Outer membrane protein beta-barrel domain